MNATLGIYDGHFIAFLTHLIRSRGMIYGIETQFDCFQNLLVGLHLRPRVNLRSNDNLLHSRSREYLTCTLIRCHGHLLIGGMGEPIRVDERLVCGIRRGNGDVPAGQRRDNSNCEGTVLIRVMRSACDIVFLEAEVGAYGQEFDFGPVRGKGREVG